MSLINRMLQDLEQQNVGSAPETRVAPIPEGVRAVGPIAAPAPSFGQGNRLLWLALGLLCLIGLGTALFLFKTQSPSTRDRRPPAPFPTPIATPIATPVAPTVAPTFQPDPVIPSVQAEPQPYDEPIPEVVTEPKPRLPAPPTPRRKPVVKANKDQKPHPVAIAPNSPPLAIKQITPQQQSDFVYQKALSAIRAGRIAEAEHGLNEALQLAPSHLAARQTLAGLLIEQGRHTAAEQRLREGVTLNPRQTEFAIPLARLLVDQGHLGKALAVLQQAQTHSPDNPDLAGFIGVLLQRMGRHGEAITQIRAALKLKPGTGTWWIALGLSLQEEKRPEESLDAFQRALSSHDLTADLQTLAKQRVRLIQHQTAP